MPPLYSLDYEAISRMRDPLLAVEYLQDHLDRYGGPEAECLTCEEWDKNAGKGADLRLEDRPDPKRAFDPTSGCAGCVYSFLNRNDSQLLERSADFCRQEFARAVHHQRRLKERHAPPLPTGRAQRRIDQLRAIWERFHKRERVPIGAALRQNS